MTTTDGLTSTAAGHRSSVAERLAELVSPWLEPLPVRVRAWDGSATGPDDAPTVVVLDPAALRRVLRHPGELGIAQAYVTGELDVEGDLLDGFRRIRRAVREPAPVRPRPASGIARAARAARSVPAVARSLRTAADLGGLGWPPPPPASQARLRGRLHSLTRDRRAIEHHYNLSNEFYALILDPDLVYSCAYWTSDDPGYTLEDAQRDKLDLICRKLDLRPGSRHLDIGCGWGALAVHAAERYGATVVGVTVSSEQKAFADRRIRERGVEGRVEIRLQDYREVPDGPFDTVSAIEMGEHVGDANYPEFSRQLGRLVRPGGRVLVQQMSRSTRPGGGPFIEAFIAPDMSMRPVGDTVAMIERAGLEVRDVHALREHYVQTVSAWYATFERCFDRVVGLVGPEVARVWRLYLVGGALAFEEGRMGVDQILAIRPTGDGRSAMPMVRAR
ncbi:cyclopropane-fatty-acyl-phospholipid synthase family protein [Intrasporangium mesophilum]